MTLARQIVIKQIVNAGVGAIAVLGGLGTGAMRASALPIEAIAQVPPAEQLPPNLVPGSLLPGAAPSSFQAPSLETVSSNLSNLGQFPLFLPPEKGILSSADDRLSPTQLSQPSFSWIRDQVSQRLDYTNLVQQWQAYSTNEGFQYVDVVVNDNVWEQLGYFRRYGFVLQFGTVAQSYQYQLRVFDSNDANNREDELAAQDNDNPTFNTASSIRLRGTYFCGIDPQLASLPNPTVAADRSQNGFPNGLPSYIKCKAFVAL